MAEQNIPAGMLGAVEHALTFRFDCEDWDSQRHLRCKMAQTLAQAALKAAGVPALLAEVEKWKTLYEASQKAVSFWDEKTRHILKEMRESPSLYDAVDSLGSALSKAEARIAELETERDGLLARVAELEAATQTMRGE